MADGDHMRSLILIAAFMLPAAAIGGCASDAMSTASNGGADHSKSAKSSDSASVDRNTRRYVKGVNACRVSAAIVRDAAAGGQTNLLDMADMTTTARDTCDNVRSALVSIDTDHFDDQATDAWGGVDEIKSGLNAVLAYIDNPRPSKIIEARNTLDDGESAAHQGIHEINVRRHAYGLHAIT
jgi:hypothetical protein